MINKFDYVLTLFQRIIGNLNYIYAFLRGVNIGKNVKFYGRTYFKKQHNSTISIGKNCTFRSSFKSNWIGINHPCLISTQGTEKAVIVVGNNCGFSGTVIAAFKGISLGNNVRCGANTLITDSDWHIEDYRVTQPKEIIIEDNVWLGVNSVVLKGVRIGKNSVIGANSIVTSDIPENVIAAGNPCKIIKKLKQT
ncbi:MAG: acyltransferase [Victivallaceae bacterium]|nr:acyltransferase [Victivallaceae bacterium]